MHLMFGYLFTKALKTFFPADHGPAGMEYHLYITSIVVFFIFQI